MRASSDGERGFASCQAPVENDEIDEIDVARIRFAHRDEVGLCQRCGCPLPSTLLNGTVVIPSDENPVAQRRSDHAV